MKSLILLAAAVTTGAGPQYHFDLARYFYATPSVEAAHRVELLGQVNGFLQQPASSLDTPAALSQWLASYDSLVERLNRHDFYVYLRAEEDTGDHVDSAADEALEAAITRLQSAVEDDLGQLGADRLRKYVANDTSLVRYRYFIDSMAKRAAHASPCATSAVLAIDPVLHQLAATYETLDNKVVNAAAGRKDEGAAGFDATWKPYLGNEDTYASLLIPIIGLHQGEARLQGFADAPAAAYFGDDLTSGEVNAALAAVRASQGYKRYIAVLASAASRHLHVAPAALRAWDLDRALGYSPARVSFPDAVPLILAAEKPMGVEYAREYGRLFDPASGRVEWCRADSCDKTGFSVGYAGLTSGLFYGSYTGDVNSMRAVAHEAGHAVHQELMAEHQPLAAYNSGPKFMFESFAIFNELLFLDHLYRTADSSAARAYYLNRFLDDATFQVWGSAKETDLEESLYAAVAHGKLHDAADLDALTLRVFARYMPAPTLDPRMRVYWARNRLYFTDPVYDVNYLFAGLLALEYLHRFHDDPAGFARRYVALLENGFTDTPQVLEKKFLGIDLDDAQGLVRDASELIARRASVLKDLAAPRNPTPPGRGGARDTGAASRRTGA